MTQLITTNSNNKSVSFGECTHLEASEIHSLSQSQIDSLWYTPGEMAQSQAERRMLLKRRERFDASKESWRGLEMTLNKNLARTRRNNIRTIVRFQHTLTRDPDPEVLARFAMEMNREATSRAVMLAAKDQNEVRSIYHHDHSLRRSSSKLSDDYFPLPATCAREIIPAPVHQKRKAAAARTA